MKMGPELLPCMVEGRFLMKANRKTTKRRERRDHEDGNQSSYLGRGKVLDGGQQEDHQKKGEKGS
jgi:hypothetical protein